MVDVVDEAGRIIGVPARDVRRLGRGRNNLTLLLETANGPFVAKHYPATPGDQRDRFDSETRALRFMAANGFECVPSLVGASPQARVAVMDGHGAPAGIDARPGDIDACVAFAGRLHDARSGAGAELIGPASEACPAPADIVHQIAGRREKLAAAADQRDDLARFFDTAFDPAFSRYKNAAKEALDGAGVDFEAPLAAALQTLSPSDFGMHNAVRRDDGVLVFVDFEYFGWDDPVRLVSDFVLHPGQRLDDAQKRRFVDGVSGIYGAADPHFARRLTALYPLVGLRWCMIMLNEFLPDRMARRRAAGETGELEDVLARQLQKASRLLAGIDDGKRQIT